MLIIFMVISIALAHPEIQVIQVVEIKDKEGGSPPAQYKLRKRDRGSTLHSLSANAI